MHVDSNEDPVGNHGEVLLVAVDLDSVQLLADLLNALRLWGRREKRLNQDVGLNVFFPNRETGTGTISGKTLSSKLSCLVRYFVSS